MWLPEPVAARESHYCSVASKDLGEGSRFILDTPRPLGPHFPPPRKRRRKVPSRLQFYKIAIRLFVKKHITINSNKQLAERKLKAELNTKTKTYI